jgi:quercetin 2,3-dioxygenase
MIKVKRAEEREVGDFGWLETRHTFSSDESKPLGFGPMCVMNEHRVSPGQGFKSHRRRDMEIITYVLEGALEHKDNIGAASVLRPGDVQVVSAGTGIRHSEFNHSKTDALHVLQIWVMPDPKGSVPRYERQSFPDADKRGRLRLMVSPDGRDGSVVIHRDVKLFATLLAKGDQVTHPLSGGHMGWLQVVRGTVIMNGQHLDAGDGAALENEMTLTAKAEVDATEILVLDLL